MLKLVTSESVRDELTESWITRSPLEGVKATARQTFDIVTLTCHIQWSESLDTHYANVKTKDWSKCHVHSELGNCT